MWDRHQGHENVVFQNPFPLIAAELMGAKRSIQLWFFGF
jgi:hypothetical protein